MSQEHIFRDIQKLKNAFPNPPANFDQYLKDLESRATQGIRLQSLYDNPVIVDLVEGYAGVVNAINLQLQTEDSSTLPDKDRDRLLDKKKMYEGFITIFLAPPKIAQVSEEVEAVLAANNLS